MAYTLIDHRNDAIKYSKLTAKLRSYAPTDALRLDDDDDDDDDDDKSVDHAIQYSLFNEGDVIAQ